MMRVQMTVAGVAHTELAEVVGALAPIVGTKVRVNQAGQDSFTVETEWQDAAALESAVHELVRRQGLAT